MAKEFPNEYTRLTSLSGGDKVFIARGSDGAPYFVFISDIIAGLPTGQSVAQAITSAVQNLQPKEQGKGLSSNDFTTTLKQKLEGIDLSQYRLANDSTGLSQENFTTLLKQKLDGLNNSGGGGSDLPEDFWITQNVTGEDEMVFNPKYLPYGYDLSPTQTELVSDGIGIKGFANIGQGGGGNTSQPAMTSIMIIDDDTANTRTLQNLPSGKTFADVETSIKGGAYVTATSNIIQIGDIAADPGQVISRFKASGSLLAGTPIANTVTYTVSGGGTGPVLERVVRLNFQSQYSSPGDTPGVTWNDLKPSNEQLGTAGGFVSANLLTAANAATTIKVTNTTAFGNASAEVSGNYDTGLYPEVIVNSGWAFNGNGTDFRITISGLNPAKYYTFLQAAVSSNGASDAVLFTIGAKTAPLSPNDNFGIQGENEYASSMWAKITNVQPDGAGNVVVAVRGTVGGWSKYLSAIIIQEYAAAS